MDKFDNKFNNKFNDNFKNYSYKNYKKYILKVAKLILEPIKNRKYKLKYYLEQFENVLKNYTKWNIINNTNNKNKFHYKSIYNEYRKWIKHNIFEISFNYFIKENYVKLFKIMDNSNFNLFIDVSKFSNKYGNEYVFKNNEYMKKNITPIMVICNEDKIPLCFSVLNESNKSSINNKKNKYHEHEIKHVNELLKKIPFNIKQKNINVNLIGDKGYITNEKFKIFNNEVKIITPLRKNNKNKSLNDNEISLLKKRHKIENYFSYLKNYDRLNVRKDRKINNYCGFIYMSMLDLIFKKVIL